MRIVAALAALVKHLLPGTRQAIPRLYRRPAGHRQAGRPPIAPALAPIRPPSSRNAFHHAFYRGLTLTCLEGYDPVHLAVISFRTGRK
jgi:hypothetical protein